jgi:hypothetical protein
LLSAKKIPAGKSGQIEVKVKTANIFGAMEKLIHVKTNDPGHRDLTLTIKAVVEPEIELSNFGIFFGSVPKGKEVRREILLTIPPGKSIRILNAETTDQRVAVKLEPVPGVDSRKWKLVAIQKADAKPGDHFGEIVVKTSSSLTPTITIFERGTITASGK